MDDLVWQASSTGALGHAVRFLPFADRIAASAVSRSFREAVIGCFRSDHALSTASFGSPATASTVSKWIAARVLPWPRLREMHVNLELDAGAAYSSLIRGLDAEQLEEVTLQGLCRRADVLGALGERCAGVRVLRFQLRGHRGHSPRFSALLKRCSALEELDATDCPFSDDQLLEALAAGQASGTAVGGPVSGSDDASADEAAGGGAAAASSGGGAAPPGLARGAAPLRRLLLGKCLHATSRGIAAVAGACPRLEELVLTGSPGVGPAAMAALASSPCAATMTVLRVPATRVADAGVTAAVAAMAGLTSLDLTAVRGLADPGLAALASAPCLPGLVDLGLGGLGPEASSGALAAVIRGCSSVRRLRLAANRYAMTDDVMDTVGASCPALEELYLRGCGSITDRGLAALAAGRCARSGLRTIDLEFCIGVGDAGVLALADGCSGLAALSLRALALAQVELGTIRAVWAANPSLLRLNIGQSGDPATLQAFALELEAAREGMRVGW